MATTATSFSSQRSRTAFKDLNSHRQTGRQLAKNVTMPIFLSVSPRGCDPIVGSALSVLRELSSNCKGARASVVVCRPMSNANLKVSILTEMDYRCSCRYLELIISWQVFLYLRALQCETCAILEDRHFDFGHHPHSQ